MSIKLGVVMDPIAELNYKKDSTLAMLWAAQQRGWTLYYMEQHDLLLDQGVAKVYIPERLEVIEEMPMTATGKVQKFTLRDIAQSFTAE